jgi:VWFA-related protein
MLLSKQLFLCILCHALFAQDSATTFSTDVRVVNLFATVHDSEGHVVRSLTKDDFTLEEDGRPQTIRYFSQESNLPLTVGLLIDTSLSQRRVLAEERAASFGFLSQVLRPDKDRAFVIHFDREVELLQDLTSSRQKLDDALLQLQTPARDAGRGRRRGGPDVGHFGGAGTELYDSVLLASDEIMRKLSGRKALILLTDGVDNGSKVGLMRAIESAQRADALLYSILFSDREMPGGRGRNHQGGYYSPVDGKKVLQRLSRETGGSFFEVSDNRPISAIYTELEEELRNQYSVGYTPDQTITGPGYRKIHLSAKQPGLVVETRDGYYSRP